jgi:CDP-2,3-bis-(O-geranylgeranyl)-sn-glycerol synthase
MDIIKELLFVFWFFGPAGLSNLAAFFSGKVSFLRQYKQPVDFGLKFRKRRVLGTHKTVRGFIAGIIIAVLTVYLEVFLYQNISWVRTIIPIDYTQINPVLLGFLLGFGALAGDAVKSFFKRQRNIPPGKSWVPFDQIDYIVGGVLLSALYIQLSIWDYFLLFLMYLLLHPFNTVLGYFVKLRKEPL